jgi:hypothetical protein
VSISNFFRRLRGPRTIIMSGGRPMFEIKSRTGAITKRYKRADHLHFIARFCSVPDDVAAIDFGNITCVGVDGRTYGRFQ